MDYKCDILIPETAGRIGELVKGSLSAKGYVCEMMSESPTDKDEFGYIRHLKKRIAECYPRVIMPIFKAEFIARHRDEFPEDILIIIDTLENIHNLDNKVLASEICKKVGVKQPRLYTDDEIDSIEHYPVVFKRPEGLSGSGVYFPKTHKAISNLVKSCSGRPHLVMDYIEGYDVCVDAIRWDGYFHAECYKVILPKQKGISILRKGIQRPDIIESVKKILDSVNYKGVCGMDFRVDKKTGEAFFLECNPRFSGGLRSQLEGGFDMPFILLQMANGKEPMKFKFKKGRYSLEFNDLITYIKSKKLFG